MRIDTYKLELDARHTLIKTEQSATLERDDEIRTTITSNEEERLELFANGSLKTGGKELSFHLDELLLSKETQSIMLISKKEKSKEPILYDPLTINLDGTVAGTDAKERFYFDIDSDGKDDNISLLSSGSGFLALDKNQNGAIDDGNELFGTKSQDGFADLAGYDDTKDGIIDENDKIFGQLKIWLRSSDKNQLMALKEANVGALLLESVNSSFDFKGGRELNAKLKKSGVALQEDGKPLWMSHIDFAIKEDTTTVKPEKSIDTNANNSTPASQPNYTGDPSVVALEGLKKKLEEVSAKLQKTDDKEERQRLETEKTRLTTQIDAIERSSLRRAASL